MINVYPRARVAYNVLGLCEYATITQIFIVNVFSQFVAHVEFFFNSKFNFK